MNGSLPPSSRLIRATRSAQMDAIRFPVSTEPVNATQSTRSSRDDRLADLAGAGEDVDDARRKVLEAVGERERGQRRQLRRLADDGVPGGERGRELPGQEQQRVVPGDDAADDAHRLLEHERELRLFDRRDHAAGEVAAHLGVVVEGRGRPADLVRVLDERLAALLRHQLGELAGARPEPRGQLVQQLSALDRRGLRPVLAASRAPAIAASTCSAEGSATSAIVSSLNGFSTSSGSPVAGDLLAPDEQPRLGHCGFVSSSTAAAKTSRCGARRPLRSSRGTSAPCCGTG